MPETVLLQITATDPDPMLARDMAQAYAEELRTLVADLETPEGKRDALIKASIVDNAQENDAPVSPVPVRNLGLAAILGLLLGLGVAVVRELLDTSVTSSDDVGSVTSAPSWATSSATPPQSALRPRNWPRRRRGPRHSGCCAPTCSTSRSTTGRSSSW